MTTRAEPAIRASARGAKMLETTPFRSAGLCACVLSCCTIVRAVTGIAQSGVTVTTLLRGLPRGIRVLLRHGWTQRLRNTGAPAGVAHFTREGCGRYTGPTTWESLTVMLLPSGSVIVKASWIEPFSIAERVRPLLVQSA